MKAIQPQSPYSASKIGAGVMLLFFPLISLTLALS